MSPQNEGARFLRTVEIGRSVQNWVKQSRSQWFARVGVCGLLLAQATLLAYSATRHSPTELEPAFLVSGVCHWTFGRFDPYRVNPPMVRLVASIPVLALGCNTDWKQLRDYPGSRAEHSLGYDFLRVNGIHSIQLLVYARWACIPFSVIGAYVAYRWSNELYGGIAGLTTLFLYVFDPSLLAHGELITPDAATTAFGIVAGYCFWRWLKQPSWNGAAVAGSVLGLAELCKMSWLILFALWPVLWLVWCKLELRPQQNLVTSPRSWNIARSDCRDNRRTLTESKLIPELSSGDSIPSLTQLVSILLVGMYVINLGYIFDGFGTRLGDFEFVSTLLSGKVNSTISGNRFRDSILGDLPIPLPKQYVLGFDSQRKDLEGFHQPSYLRGQLKKHGGWWYYYIYGLLVKVPCGTWGLLVIVIITRATRSERPVPLRDELILVAPAAMLLVVVSAHTEFNCHLRYVFPSLGLCLIFLGQSAVSLTRKSLLIRWTTSLFLTEILLSLVLSYPHHLAYFNAFVGGSKYGYQHLTGSSLDWGQDLLCLRDHVQVTGDCVIELRGSDVNGELVRRLIPVCGRESPFGRRIVVVSPNCVEKGIPFPPDGTMLTPTLWIVEPRENRRE